MARKTKPVPTEPGQGVIAVSLPVALMLERTAIGIPGYLALVRGGTLDTARRPNKFTSEPGAIERLRGDYGRTIPDGLPDLAGDVTWRRVTGRWSLDVNHGLLSPGVHWWEQIAKGTGDAQIRIEGVVFPETVMAEIDAFIGRPLAKIISHPLLMDERIVVRSLRSYAPTRFNGKETPGSVEIKLDVPRLEFDDPAPVVALGSDAPSDL